MVQVLCCDSVGVLQPFAFIPLVISGIISTPIYFALMLDREAITRYGPFPVPTERL